MLNRTDVMTKSDLIQFLATKLSLPGSQSEQVVDTIVDAIIEALKRNERVELRGFGSFETRHYKAYQGRNPKTGAVVDVKAKRLPFFRVGKELRERVDRFRPGRVLNAYHEAGHAVAITRFGFGNPEVTIRPGGTGLGASAEADVWEDRVVAGKILVSIYAGFAAQAHHDQAEEATARDDARADFEDADTILGFAHKGADELLQQQQHWLGRARRFVTEPKNWAAIEAVAQELVANETLVGEEVDSVIDAADGDPDAKEQLAFYRATQHKQD
jgi:integration host factor subunit beta